MHSEERHTSAFKASFNLSWDQAFGMQKGKKLGRRRSHVQSSVGMDLSVERVNSFVSRVPHSPSAFLPTGSAI